jgi:hypothetical protein
LDPTLVARGGRWKLGEEDLRTVPRDVLERMMVAAESEVMENIARARQAERGAPPEQPQQPSWMPKAEQAKPPEAAGVFAPVELKFDEADEDAPATQHAKALNEGMTKNFNSLYTHVQSKLDEFARAIDALHQFNDATVLDRHLADLGDEWQDVFGKGAMFELDQRGPHYTARKAYRDAILETLDLDAQLGRERDRSEAMLRARYRLHGPKIAQLERAKREAKAKETAKALPASTAPPNGKAPAGGLRDSVYRAVSEMTMAR